MSVGSRFFLKTRRSLALAGLWLLLALSSIDARAEAIRPDDLLVSGDWQLAIPHPGDALLQTLKASDASSFGDLLRLRVKVPSEPVWLVQIAHPIAADVPAGHVLKLHFWARSATSNPLRISIEEATAPYQGVAGGSIKLNSQWQEYTFSGPTTGFGPNGLSVHFQAGSQAGIVEIAGVSVKDAGAQVIPAAVRTALRPEQIQARIEKFRKGDLTVRVKGADGRPLQGAVVKITQTSHAFLFGCNCFALNPSDPSPPQRAYQSRFVSLFNYATLPFYWGAFEPHQGQPDYNRLDSMARWGLAHDLTLKGHPLIYHEVWPAWAPLETDAAIPLLKARVSDVILHFKDLIHYWDVLNEANGAADFAPPNGESRWIRRDGPAAVVGTALDWARSAQEATGGAAETFIYNDYDTGQMNVDLQTQLQMAGKLPDVIGIQSHMHAGNWPMEKVWQVCETFSHFGRPLHFTECTVLSGPKRLHASNDADATDWNTTPEDEARQADYVAQFYTLLFSHPAVHAITWWDLSDKFAWMGAPGGLLRKDMSPKPAYLRLMELIHRTWWTDVTGPTDQTGAFSGRVFYGTYRITVTGANGRTESQTITFPESAPPLSVTILLP